MRRSPLFTLFVTSAIVITLFVLTLVFDNRPNLGLDLQGGVSVVLQPVARNGGEVTKEALEETKSIIEKRVNDIGVGEPDITIQGQTIVVQLPGIKDQKRALDTIGATAELRFRPVLEVLGVDLTRAQRRELEKTRDRLRKQLEIPGGVTAAQVFDAEQTARGLPTLAEQQQQQAAAQAALQQQQQQQGGDPASQLTDPATGQPIDLSAMTIPDAGDGTGGSRSFKYRQTTTTDTPTTTVAPVPTPAEAPTTTAVPAPTTTMDPAPQNSYGVPVYGDPEGNRDSDFDELFAAEARLEASRTQTTPIEDDIAENEVILKGKFADQDADGKDLGVSIYRLGPALLTGKAIEDAQANVRDGEWEVLPTFREGPEGIDLFNAAAQKCNTRAPECPSEQLAIVLDGLVITAPSIDEATFSRDQIQIRGSFGEDEAKDVASKLRYGALPLTLELQQVQTVSATLGKGALRAGIISGGVGLLLVALYITAYYRLLGVVTLGSLLMSSMALWTVIGFFGATQGLTLTLSGVVGIVVSVGVSLDSSVVYYENLKEDVRNGRTVRSAVNRSFTSAYGTIVKADMSSLIGAVILYFLSVGPVRGFAFYLGLSTLLDLLFAYFFVRPGVAAMGLSRLVNRPRLFGIPADRPGSVPSPPAGASGQATSGETLVPSSAAGGATS